MCNNCVSITGSVLSPMQLTLRAVSCGSVEVNWTQPVSVLQQYNVSNHSITCTSSHGVYTTTSQHVTTPAVNESTHIHTIISGLMSNTSYTCCVSAHSELGSSESICDTVITGNHMSKYTCKAEFCYSKETLQSHIEMECPKYCYRQTGILYCVLGLNSSTASTIMYC